MRIAENVNRWRLVNTWNGGAGGERVVFTSKATGAAGHNECFEWVHRNTPFSFHEATTNQGYRVEREPNEGDRPCATN